MKNIENRVIGDNYTILAALHFFCLLSGRRSSPALSAPERVLALEQVSVLSDERAFPCRLNRAKPGLPWGAREDFRVAYFGRSSGAALVVSPQVRSLDTRMLFEC